MKENRETDEDGEELNTADSKTLSRKSPAVAVVLNIIPGLGHIYCGLLARAVVLIFIFAGLIHSMNRGVETAFIPLVFTVFYIFMYVDAYRCAKRVNREDIRDFSQGFYDSKDGEKQGLLFWGFFLMVLGMFFQLHNLGYGTEWIVKLWPLILIILGLRIIFKLYTDKKEKVT